MKKIILTFTPNPALDVSGEVDRVVPNEKNYVHSEMRNPGGNAINVSRVLNRLNTPTTASGFLGGPIGIEFQSLLNAEKVKTDFIPIQGNTRINITVQNLKTHNQTRLSFPGPVILASEKEKSLKYLRTKKNSIQFAVLGGSFPPGYTVSDALKWIKLCQSEQIPMILDVPGKLLGQFKNAHLNFIKPNWTEWMQATGWRSSKKEHTIDVVIDRSRSFFKNTDWVCISSFGGGALLIGKETVYHATLPKLTVRSTVGAGDSMVAGWIHGQNLCYKPSDSLRLSMACAGATLQTRGTELANKKDVLRLFPKVKVVRIQ